MARNLKLPLLPAAPPFSMCALIVKCGRLQPEAGIFRRSRIPCLISGGEKTSDDRGAVIRSKSNPMTTGPSAGIATSPEEPLAFASSGSLWSGKRFYIAALLFLNLFINFMHRINLSVAAPAIAKDFGWDAGKMGLLFSSYQWTYCLFLLLWGWMSDRLGTRTVNGLSVTIWSIAGMLTGVATSFLGMLASRLALGAGEAASFPTSGKVVRQWFPPKERGLATAIFNAGTFAGPAFSAPLVAWLLLREGWRFSFMITGSLGFVWVGLWLKFFRTPAECSWLPAQERNYILAETDSQVKCFGCPLIWCRRAICL